MPSEGWKAVVDDAGKPKCCLVDVPDCHGIDYIDAVCLLHLFVGQVLTVESRIPKVWGVVKILSRGSTRTES
jgi:hypothetical protein